MARSDPQFNLRIPQELKDQIEKSAKDDGRSINAQAVYLLQKGLQPSDQTNLLTQILTEIQAIKKATNEVA